MEKLIEVKVEYDEDAESPRTYDNAGVMYCEHSRRTLGDKDADDPFTSEYGAEIDGIWMSDDELQYAADMLVYNADPNWEFGVDMHNAEELENAVGTDERRVLRSDVAICLPLYLYDHGGVTMSHGSFSDPWDSGQVGWHYMTKDVLQREFEGDETRGYKRLEAELKEYDNYLRGYCYWFACGDDSCGGFIGTDIEETGMLGYVGPKFHDALRKAFDNIGKTIYCTPDGEVVDPDDVEVFAVRRGE